jgi:hypothetical protein
MAVGTFVGIINRYASLGRVVLLAAYALLPAKPASMHANTAPASKTRPNCWMTATMNALVTGPKEQKMLKMAYCNAILFSSSSPMVFSVVPVISASCNSMYIQLAFTATRQIIKPMHSIVLLSTGFSAAAPEAPA